MFRSLFIAFLVGVIATNILWFSFGRGDYKSILGTTEELRNSVREAQQTGNSISVRLDAITGTASRIDATGREIEQRSKELNAQGSVIGAGIGETNTAVNRIEIRNREIISIVGRLGKINEDFRLANKRVEVEK